jgi:hypothetical protein
MKNVYILLQHLLRPFFSAILYNLNFGRLNSIIDICGYAKLFKFNGGI